MKAFPLFVLICVLLGQVVVKCDTSERDTLTKNVTVNCNLREDEEPDKVLLSRKKRFLTFPEGSAFVSTISIVKALLFDQTPPTNLAIEYDVIWPIPSNTKKKIAEKRVLSKKISRPSRWRVHRRQRRELYANYEAALDSRDLPGKDCMLRTICEARSVLSPPGISFVEDLLRIILSNFARSKSEADEYDMAYALKKDCDMRYWCPFSILELLLSFDQNFIPHSSS